VTPQKKESKSIKDNGDQTNEEFGKDLVSFNLRMEAYIKVKQKMRSIMVKGV